MTEEFFMWASNIKTMMEKRVDKFTYVWIAAKDNVITIGIDCINGMRFFHAFDQEEFNKNNYNQRRSLAKVRRENMIRDMQDHCAEILQVAKKLS